MSIPIVIPSMGRPREVTTHKVFPDGAVQLCVPESQEDAYASAYPDLPVIAHPDDVIGLSQKRQWIYDRWGDVVMIDDDIVAIVHLEHSKGDRQHKLRPDQSLDVVNRVAQDAREYGAYLFGLHSTVNPTSYLPFRPFRTTGWVNGGFTGLLAGSKLAYHPDIRCKEDFWISGLNAYHHRKMWVDTRYALLDRSGSGTMKTTGGMATIRSVPAEAHDNKILERHFGRAVIKPRAKNAKVGAIHDEQRSFQLPW